MITEHGELVTAYLVLRGEDVVVDGIVSASGDVEVLAWQRRGTGAALTWTPTAREQAQAEMALWEAWGWAWWLEDAA